MSETFQAPDPFRLAGREVLVTGLANKKSVAWHIGRALEEAGAIPIYTVHTEERRESVKKLAGDREVLVCDVREQDQIDAYTAKADGLGIGGRVHLIGRWPADKLGDLLIEGDILAAPRTKGINTPQKVFPYLHTGRAVLVTDLPTHSQILTQEVCRLAPAEPAGFGGAIAELANNKEVRISLGKAGKAFAERDHTYTAHKQRVESLYSTVEAAIGV